jgi:hypothetical protein
MSSAAKAALLLIFCISLRAATPTGSLAGIVLDASLAVVGGAAITATQTETGIRRATSSATDGTFSLPFLAPGHWTLLVEAPGFEPARSSTTRIAVDQIAQVVVPMNIAGEHSSADVHATYGGSPGEIISRESIAQLPLNGRQYLDLARLAPGLVPAPAGTQGLGFNLAGSRSQSNVYLLDGISNQDTQNSGALNAFRLGDALEEFDVQTAPALPEFGRGSGAQINAVTRSGGNTLHGSAFEYIRNTAFSAADFFTNKLGGKKSPLNRNQFGGTIGGPLMRNRTFFFASYEGFLQVAHVVSSTRVPSLDERGSVSDAVSRALLDFWPRPNVWGALNYISDVRNQDFDHTGLVRLDHRLSAKDQLSARWIEYRGSSIVAGPTPLTGGNSGDPLQRSGMVRHTRAFSPLWTNEFVAGFSANRQERDIQDRGVNPSQVIPFPGVPNGQYGLPALSISGGYAPLGSNQNFPQGRYTSTAEFSDNVAWRSMRWGFQMRRDGLRQYLDRASRGVINFSSFANFARGQINSATFRTGDTLAHWRRTPLALYWQDALRLHPGLTLDFGLRYESGSPSAERDHRAANFVPGIGPVLVGTNQVLTIDPTLRGAAALKTAPAGVDLPAAGIYADRNNFAPMAGLSWSLPGSLGSLILRAGYRLSYDEPFGNLLTSMALAPPFSLQTSQTANVTQPGQFGWAVAFNQNVPLISNYGKQGPGTPVSGVLTLQGLDPHLRSPYVQHYNFAIRKALGRSLLLEGAYQGSAGRKLGIYLDVNQPAVIVRDPTRRGTVAPNEQVFPYPQWGQVQIVKSVGNSNYNGAVVTLRGHLPHTTHFEASWTYGKSLDYNSSYFGTGNLPGEPGAPPDSTNLRLEHGPSSFDLRHRLVAIFGTDFHGWQLNAITTAQSGTPFTVVSGNPDSNGFNQSTAGVSPNGGNRPDIIRTGSLPHDYRNPDAAFDTTWFAAALAGRVGTSGRNQYYGPGLVNVDLSIARGFAVRRVAVRENLSFQARADFFNLFNHTNFANPVADLSNVSFGRITQTLGSAVSNAVGTSGGATGAPRVIQISLRLMF